MKILALESAAQTASAALMTEDELIAEYTSNFKRTHSETLLPMIDEIVRMTETDKKTIDAVAVSEGPGSFTGLRIGAAEAKGIAFALNIPVIGVPTPDSAAYGMYGSSFILCPLMDARRDQTYSGLYEFSGEEFIVHEPASALSIDEQVKAAEELSSRLGKEIMYLGDGLDAFREKILELSEKTPHFAPPHVRYRTAASVGALGLKLLKEGKGSTAENFLPVYLRKSQAEREREAMGLPLE